MSLSPLVLMNTILLFGQTTQPADWKFDPAQLLLGGSGMTARFRVLGAMHGLVIDQFSDAGSPTARGRAFLNLEHYIEKGRCGEYLPRKLDQSATIRPDAITIHFPQPADWPVISRLTYTTPAPLAVDAKLDFSFSGSLSQFEVYFTSYFDPQYERSMKIGGKWVRPDISPKEQLLIPRDDQVAARYEDGRWNFLKGRTRLLKEKFDLPVMISKNDKTGATIVQMIEPGLCTHIAPNRFAVGHNFIVGGWDVKAGDHRSARIRLLAGRNIPESQVEKAYDEFARYCEQTNSKATKETR